MGLKRYSVHQAPFAPVDQARFVRDGFSWAAFFFGPFWAFYHRMWGLGVTFIAIEIMLAAADELIGFTPVNVSIIGFAWSLLFSFEANDILRAALIKRGWPERGLASGVSREMAEHDWFRRAAAR